MNTEAKEFAVGDIVYHYCEQENKIIKCRIDNIENDGQHYNGIDWRLLEISRKVDDVWVPYAPFMMMKTPVDMVYESKTECKKRTIENVVKNMQYAAKRIEGHKNSIQYYNALINNSEKQKESLQKILDNICRL